MRCALHVWFGIAELLRSFGCSIFELTHMVEFRVASRVQGISSKVPLRGFELFCCFLFLFVFGGTGGGGVLVNCFTSTAG